MGGGRVDYWELFKNADYYAKVSGERYYGDKNERKNVLPLFIENIVTLAKNVGDKVASVDSCVIG